MSEEKQMTEDLSLLSELRRGKHAEVRNNRYWILEFARLAAPESQPMAGRDFGFSGISMRSVIKKRSANPDVFNGQHISLTRNVQLVTRTPHPATRSSHPVPRNSQLASSIQKPVASFQ